MRIRVFGKIVVLAIAAGLTLTAIFWQPFTPSNPSLITTGHDKDLRMLTEKDDAFSETANLIKKTFKSSKSASFQYMSGRLKVKCSDITVDSFKDSLGRWYELTFENAKYKKFFFTLTRNDYEYIVAYATKTDSYDDGKILQYGKCNVSKLSEWTRNKF